MLIKLNSSLKRITRIRSDFLFMKCYFVSCRVSILPLSSQIIQFLYQSARQLRILQYLCRHQHFVESADLYTMSEVRHFTDSDRISINIVDAGYCIGKVIGRDGRHPSSFRVSLFIVVGNKSVNNTYEYTVFSFHMSSL